MTEPIASKPINPHLLSRLRCPLSGSPLRQEGDELISDVSGLRYPVRDGIPCLLMEEATLPAGAASLDELKKKFSRS